MQVVFRFRETEEIVVSNQVGGVVLFEIYKGIKGYTGVAGGEMTKRERVQTLLNLSKSEARSIASAMMGAAAEA